MKKIVEILYKIEYNMSDIAEKILIHSIYLYLNKKLKYGNLTIMIKASVCPI